MFSFGIARSEEDCCQIKESKIAERSYRIPTAWWDRSRSRCSRFEHTIHSSVPGNILYSNSFPFSIFFFILFYLDFNLLSSSIAFRRGDEMGNFFGFRRRRGNTRSGSGIDGSFRFDRVNSGSVVEQRRAEVAARYPATSRSMSSQKEKDGASHGSSAAPTAPKSKSNKYTFIPDNFTTIQEVTFFFYFYFLFLSLLGFSALKLVVWFGRLWFHLIRLGIK